MLNLDNTVTAWINGLSGHSPLIDNLLTIVSSVGVPCLVLAVAAQWWTGGDRKITRHVIVAAGFSFLLGLAINQVILLFIARIRPYDGGITHLLIGPSSDPSFPSDHATASFAIVAAFLLHGFRLRGLVFLLGAALVSLSRVYLGIHFAGDIVGGVATGVLAAVIVAAAYRRETRLDRILTSIF